MILNVTLYSSHTIINKLADADRDQLCGRNETEKNHGSTFQESLDF